MKDISLRPMTEGDLPAADGLRRCAGWNQTLEDWRRLLWCEPHGCFAALQDAEIIGTVTTITYGEALAWIGMMLVHPDFRQRGVGTGLMHRALEYLRGRDVACVKLDATPAGRPVYEKLGFVQEWTLTRCHRPVETRTESLDGAATVTRDLSDADWGAVDALDEVAFGAPRSRLLRSLGQQSRATRVWPAQGHVVGWGMLRPGASADYLGPLVCASAEGALSLVAALVRLAGSRSIIWDVPDPNPVATAAARRFGFTPIRPLTRMRLGADPAGSDTRSQVAIADPAVG